MLRQPKRKNTLPLKPSPKEGTKEYVKEFCPEFYYDKYNCIDGLNQALKKGFRVTETYKEGKYIIYMLRKTNKIAMCKVKTQNALILVRTCLLIYGNNYSNFRCYSNYCFRYSYMEILYP